ncbi:MAG: hypothetical protein WA003_07580 [Desulfuromonadaceae bacterium]
MDIGYQYIPLILAGLAGMIWGVPAAHRLKSPYDIVAAAAVLCGCVAFAFGILLTIIPGFF